MNNWKPITAIELERLIEAQLKICTHEQQDFFFSHRIPLKTVPIHRFGQVEQVFVVACVDEEILYYEDVEEGFELARLDSNGHIQSQGCSQYELHHILSQFVLDPNVHVGNPVLEALLPVHTLGKLSFQASIPKPELGNQR